MKRIFFKKITTFFIITASASAICLLLYQFQYLKKTPVLQSSEAQAQTFEPLMGRWVVLQKSELAKLHENASDAKSVKIIFVHTNEKNEKSYLVARKKARGQGKKGTKKNGLWEFPGGRTIRNESILMALLRELYEEDNSHTLKEELENIAKTSLNSIYFQELKLKNGERTILLRADLNETALSRLEKFWRERNSENIEVFGFDLIDLESLDSRNKSIKEKWTPKSRKILKALRKASNAS